MIGLSMPTTMSPSRSWNGANSDAEDVGQRTTASHRSEPGVTLIPRRSRTSSSFRDKSSLRNGKPVISSMSRPSGTTSHRAGTSPSHGQPECLEAHVRIEPARDGAVDHGLLLLVQQRDQLLLGADRAPDPPVGVVEEADNRRLLGERWDDAREMLEVVASRGSVAVQNLVRRSLLEVVREQQSSTPNSRVISPRVRRHMYADVMIPRYGLRRTRARSSRSADLSDDDDVARLDDLIGLE